MPKPDNIEESLWFRMTIVYFSGEGEPLADLIVESKDKASREETDFIRDVTLAGFIRWLHYGNSKVN